MTAENRTLLKRIYRIIVLAVSILALLLSLLIFAPLLFGLRPYTITSTSMSPVINKGDVIYVKKVQPDSLKKDDIITFYQTGGNTIVTHRIARIDKDKKLIYTIGDANFTEDYTPIAFDDVIGLYSSYKLPLLVMLY